jgi:hypothetical protein
MLAMVALMLCRKPVPLMADRNPDKLGAAGPAWAAASFDHVETLTRRGPLKLTTCARHGRYGIHRRRCRDAGVDVADCCPAGRFELRCVACS